MFKSTVIKIDHFTYDKNGKTNNGASVWFTGSNGLPMKNWLDPDSDLKAGDPCVICLEPDRYCNARIVVKKA